MGGSGTGFVCTCSMTAVMDNKLGITQPPATTAAPPMTAAPAATTTPAPYVPQPFMPIPYTHLWVSSDGNTHIAECTVQNLTLSAYGGISGLLSASYNDLLVNATLALFVQLPAGQYNPPHNAPVSQFGITMQGSWCCPSPTSHPLPSSVLLCDSATIIDRIVPLHPCRYAKTSDGSVRHFMPGNLLFQDNTPSSPAANTPNAARHISGNDGTVPCDVLGIQVVFPPTVDHPCPF